MIRIAARRPPSGMILVAAAVLLGGASAPGVRAQTPARAGHVVVLTHGTLIDGTGGPPRADVTVVISGSRIEAVEPADGYVLIPTDAQVHDLAGAFVLPGLIDAHVHLATVPERADAEARLARYLRSGITSVRDMAGDDRLLSDLARASRLDEIPAPDVYYSALMAGPSFLSDPRPQASARGAKAGEVPWMQAITPGTDIVRAVARAQGTWATGIKIYSDLEAAEVRRIAEEAHAQGMKVWAHATVFPTRPQDVVGAGVDVISHVCRIAYAAVPAAGVPRTYATEKKPDHASFSLDDAAFEELFAEMARRGTVLDATLALYVRMAEQQARRPGGRELPCDVDFAKRVVKRAHDRGVPIDAGTDFQTPDDSLPALFVEIESLVRDGGLRPSDALVSATAVGAKALGIEATHGTVEPGKVANLLIVGADPTTDVSNLRQIRMVMKNGTIVRGGS